MPDPQTLVDSATCLTCIPKGAQWAVLVNLFAGIAGVSNDPAALAERAKCINAQIPPGAQMAVLIALAAQVADISADPAQLVDAARCVDCAIMPGMLLPVMIAQACSMAGTSCDAQTLMDNARCIEHCLPPGDLLPVLISLFSVLAGVEANSAELLQEARCIECGVPTGMLLSVFFCVFSEITLNPTFQMRIILIANYLDGVAHANVTVDYPDTTGATALRLMNQNVKSAEDASLQTLGSVLLSNTPLIDALLLPSLVTITNVMDATGTALATLSLPALQSIGSNGLILSQSQISVLSLPALTSCGIIEVFSVTTLPTLSLPALITAHSVTVQNGNVTAINLPDLTTVTADFNFAFGIGGTANLPSLATVGGSIGFQGLSNQGAISLPALTQAATAFLISCPTVPSYSAPLLAQVFGTLTISNNDVLTSVNLASLDLSGGVVINFNPLLTSVVVKPSNQCLTWDCQDNALSQSAVDNILASCVAGGGMAGQINLQGGTNSTPSAGGLADKATLEGNGWTVTVN